MSTHNHAPPTRFGAVKVKHDGHHYLYQFAEELVGETARLILLDALDVDHPMPWEVAARLLRYLRHLGADIAEPADQLMRDITRDAMWSDVPHALAAADEANQRIRETIKAAQ